jgi:hypothetical protein
MRRLIPHLLVATATFCVGTVSQLIFRAPITQIEKPQTIESIAIPLTKPSAVIANTSTPENKLVWDYDVDQFNPRGVYYLLGPKPRAFPEFDSLELAVYPNDLKAEGQVTIQIVVNHTYESQDAASGLVSEHGLSFSTVSITDTQCDYTFDGYFLRTGELFKAGQNEAVLEGQLTKSKNGVRLAVAKVRFRVEYLGC